MKYICKYRKRTPKKRVFCILFYFFHKLLHPKTNNNNMRREKEKANENFLRKLQGETSLPPTHQLKKSIRLPISLIMLYVYIFFFSEDV